MIAAYYFLWWIVPEGSDWLRRKSRSVADRSQAGMDYQNMTIVLLPVDKS